MGLYTSLLTYDKLYSSSDSSITFNYPDVWLVNDKIPPENGLKIITVDAPQYGIARRGEFREGLAIMYGDAEETQAVAKVSDIITSYKTDLEHDERITKVFEIKEIVVSGYPMASFEYTVVDSRTKSGFHTNREIIGLVGSKIFRFTFADAEDEFLVSSEILDKILTSMILK